MTCIGMFLVMCRVPVAHSLWTRSEQNVGKIGESVEMEPLDFDTRMRHGPENTDFVKGELLMGG